ncbi:ABC transporter substrate-binding protein [Afifella pfennigii]|uniref:ABC transporter substrate-binding protein n=1 Tax=Afifella pfennigii TaxID=209897 RepID=UPI00047DEA4C|nr:ABC transporter substrate-binding protein [Afifella pfennigii]
MRTLPAFLFRAALFLTALLAAPQAPAAELVPEATAVFGAPAGGERLLIKSTTDVAAFRPALEAFAGTVPGLRIDYEQWASNDLYAVAAKACAQARPAADLLVSSAVDLQVRLVNDGCARPHRSALTDRLPEDLNWRSELFGVTRELAVMVYNTRLVPPREAPRSRFDLIDLLRPPGSNYAGRIATYDIEQSGLGYLFAFVDAQQATTFGALSEALGRSGAVATCCSAEIIDGVARGDYLIAYNVLSSYALARAETDERLAVVAPEDYTLVLSRAALIPKGAENAFRAAAFIDFLLSPPGRSALQATHLLPPSGATGDAALGLSDPDDATLRPIALSPSLLVGLDRHKRAQFIRLWRQTFPWRLDRD